MACVLCECISSSYPWITSSLIGKGCWQVKLAKPTQYPALTTPIPIRGTRVLLVSQRTRSQPFPPEMTRESQSTNQITRKSQSIGLLELQCQQLILFIFYGFLHHIHCICINCNYVIVYISKCVICRIGFVHLQWIIRDGLAVFLLCLSDWEKSESLQTLKQFL